MNRQKDLPDNLAKCISEDDILESMREIPGYIDLTPGDFRLLYEKVYDYMRTRIMRGTRAGGIMKTPPVCISQERSLAELVLLLAGRGISGVPVLDADGKVVGVVSEKDILRSLGHPPEASLMRLVADSLDAPLSLTPEEKGRLVENVMSAPAVTIEESATLADILAIFGPSAINRLPVVDAGGRPVGIITRQDVIKAFGRLL